MQHVPVIPLFTFAYGSVLCLGARKMLQSVCTISTFEAKNEILEYFYKSKRILSDAGFNLREWNSDSEKLNDMLPDCGNRDVNCKILGINWNTQKEELKIRIKNVENPSLTKRVVVSQSAAIYDPIGFQAPCIIKNRIFLQRLLKLNRPWDQKLGSDLQSEWRSIYGDLKSRCTGSKNGLETSSSQGKEVQGQTQS